MCEPDVMLGESASAALARLEEAWRRALVRTGRGKGWQSVSLVKAWQKAGICATELQAWQVLDELDRAGRLALPPGTRLSPHFRLPVRVRLAEWRCEQLAADQPVVDAGLALTPEQAAAWHRALTGPLGDWSASDQQALADGLRRLAGDLPGAYALSPYVASARYLLGSSKLLEALPNDLLRAFGIEPSSFTVADARLLASMPATPEGVILIENLQSFSQACRVGLDARWALVCSFGYGLSLGEALGGLERVRLVGEGPLSHTMTGLLALSNLTYWGDLDPEGLRIFRQLRRRLPGLRLSALYRPMIDAFEATRGHPLHGLTGKEGQRQVREWRRGLDQEWLDDDVLATLAGQSLDPSIEACWMERLETRE